MQTSQGRPDQFRCFHRRRHRAPDDGGGHLVANGLQGRRLDLVGLALGLGLLAAEVSVIELLHRIVDLGGLDGLGVGAMQVGRVGGRERCGSRATSRFFSSTIVSRMFMERQKAEWRRIGVWEFTDTKTSIHYKMNVNFIDDIEQHKYEYDPLTAISKLRIPILILHGSQDMTVPKEQAISLLKASHPGDVQMELIETSGHTFGVEHPMRTPSPALGTAIKSTVLFFGMK